MNWTSFILLVIYIVSLAAATWTGRALYHSTAFFLLNILLVGNFLLLAFRKGYFRWKKAGMLLVHFSFILILAGAALTHFFGQEGLVHIREGQSVDKMYFSDEYSRHEIQLPFELYLDDFNIERYPGSDSPSSYESFLTVRKTDGEFKAHVYMNNVLKVDGYRFYQSSFDPDEKGTILSVNRDVAGCGTTYAGYICLFIGLLAFLIDPDSRLGILWKQLRELQSKKLILLVSCVLGLGLHVHAQDLSPYKIDKDHAARFGHLSIQSASGRIMPVNTFSSEILRKLYKEKSIGEMDPDQFLLGMLAWPEVWKDLQCISVENDALSEKYGLSYPYASYREMFEPSGDYKLFSAMKKIYSMDPSARSSMDKDMLKLDERVNIFHMIAEGSMVRENLILAGSLDGYLEEVRLSASEQDWSSADQVLEKITVPHAKTDVEITYNRLDVFRRCKSGYLIGGGLILVWVFCCMLGLPERAWIRRICIAAVLAVFLFHMYGMGLRWYIGGYAPWSNSYETMIYVSWAAVLSGLLFGRRNMLVFALATLLGGVILFVSGLNWMNPQITPLVPVLKSPWLMFHVAVIVAAYGFLGLSCLLGLVNTVLAAFRERKNMNDHIRELTIINEMSVWTGLVLLTVGTFLGAIWANESWGRYWGWDPKETWALITILCYVTVTHVRLLKCKSETLIFNILSVLAFASVLMTYFGVGYFFDGMHAY